MPDPTYNPAAPQPVGAPPKKSGSSALKIILIIVGIFVVLGVLVIGVIGYGVWRVHKAIQTGPNGQVKIGNFTANTNNQFTESDLGIAIYPGAEQQKDSLRMSLGGKTMITANYLTPDSKDQVIAFYKDKAGPNAQSMVTNDMAQFIVDVGGGDQTTVMITQRANMHNGETSITIVRAPKS